MINCQKAPNLPKTQKDKKVNDIRFFEVDVEANRTPFFFSHQISLNDISERFSHVISVNPKKEAVQAKIYFGNFIEIESARDEIVIVYGNPNRTLFKMRYKKRGKIEYPSKHLKNGYIFFAPKEFVYALRPLTPQCHAIIFTESNLFVPRFSKRLEDF